MHGSQTRDDQLKQLSIWILNLIKKKKLYITFSHFSELNVTAFQYQKSLLTTMMHKKKYFCKMEFCTGSSVGISGIRRILPIPIAWHWILISFFPRATILLKSLEFILAMIQGFNVETSACKNAWWSWTH